MGTTRTDEFRADAVQISLTSGMTHRQVASDFSVGPCVLTLTAFTRFKQKEKLNALPLAADITVFQKDLREKQRASPATIRWRLVAPRSYFGWLCENDAICPSPFEGLRLYMRLPKRLPSPVDWSTLAAVFRSAQHIVQHSLSEELSAPKETPTAQIKGLIARLLIVTGLCIEDAEFPPCV